MHAHLFRMIRVGSSGSEEYVSSCVGAGGQVEWKSWRVSPRLAIGYDTTFYRSHAVNSVTQILRPSDPQRNARVINISLS